MGINFGYNYTLRVRRTKNMIPKGAGSIYQGRPVKVLCAETREQIHFFDKFSECVEQLKVAASNIRSHCKKNIGKYPEDCIVYGKKYIFMYGEEAMF